MIHKPENETLRLALKYFVGMSDERQFYVGRMPQREGFVSQSMDGKAVALPLGRLPHQDVGYVGMAI
ncbi:MAG TPA: hypothetical protein VF600_02395 [Abditibacteriaceae bacterium]